MKRNLMVILITALLIQCSITQDNKNNLTTKIDSLKTVLGSNPGNTNTIIDLGQALQFNGQVKEAIDLLKDAKNKFPDNPKIAIWFANSESIMAGTANEIPEKVKWSQYAISDLDATVQKFNDDWYVHYIRGINSMNWPDMFQRKPIAIEDFEFLLNYDKNYPGVISTEELEKIHYYLGYAYYKTNAGSDKYMPQFDYVKKNFPNSQFIKDINEIAQNSKPNENQ